MGHLVDNVRKQRWHSWVQMAAILGVMCILVVAIITIPRPSAQAVVQHSTSNGAWPTYLHDVERNAYNPGETIINPTTAPNLKVHWTNTAASSVSSEPVEANGMIYWGSWDGLEHATDPTTGKDVWTANLGNVLACNPTPVGVHSSATVTSVPINGAMTTTVFVGGGNGTLYALDANTGNILWQTLLGQVPQHFLYAAPVVYNGSVYMGVSSFSDCPLVQGQMVQLNASTGAIQHTFNVVPNGCLGGTVWGSPAFAPSLGLLYFGTGNEGKCSTTETMTDAIIALHVSDLSLAGYWQIPTSQQYADGDFGSTPTLFKGKIGGVLHMLVGLVDKNGIYYTFDQSNVSAGPQWQVQLAVPGNKPDHGQGSIGTSAFDGKTLYVVGAATTINGASCGGSIRALDPATGKFLWEVCFAKTVLAPAVTLHGLVIIGTASWMYVLDSTSGKTLFRYHDKTTGSDFWGAASVSNGILYIGNMDGTLYAFGL